MKKKISKILGVVLSLTLVLSLAVVFLPAPVAGSPGTDYWTTFDYPLEGDDGGWVYSDTIGGGPGPIAKAIDGSLYAYAGIGPVADLGNGTWSDTLKVSGSSSAKLDSTSSDLHATVDFIPATGTTLADADTVAELANFSFRYYEAAGLYGPHLELKFEDGSGGLVDLTFMVQWRGARDEWTRALCNTDAHFQGYNIYPGTGSGTDYATLALFIAAVDALTDAQKAYTLTRVRLELFPGGGDRECYFDDVTIDGITYNLEGVDASTADGTAEVSYLMKSTDDGRTWEATYYSDATYGVLGGEITAIACSSLDADIVYVADEDYVYKTEDGGATFAYVAQDSLEDDTDVEGASEDITCLAVGW